MDGVRERPPGSASDKLLGVAFWIVVAACALPLWITRYLPFTDLPEHVAAMSTIAHCFDPKSVDAGIYEIAVGRGQYIAYHGLGALLTLVLGDGVLANRVLLTGIAIGTPLSARAALRALGKDEALALFAGLPFLSRPLFVGLLPYTASIPLYLLGVALVARTHADRQARDGARGPVVALVGVALVMVFTHLSSTVVFFGTAALLEVLLSLRDDAEDRPLFPWLVRRGRALAPLLPAVVATGLWTLLGRITFRGESISAPGAIGTMSFFRSVRAMPLWTFDILRSHVDEVCGALWWLALAMLAVLGARASAPVSIAEEPSRPRWQRILGAIDPAFAPLLAVLFAYVVTPFRVGAAGMLNVRLAPLVAITAILTVSRGRSQLRRWFLLGGALVSVVHAVNAAHAIGQMGREEVGELDTILAAMRPGSRLVTLAFDTRRSRAHIDPYPFVGSYHRARGGGVASYSFSDLPHWSVQYLAAEKPPQKTRPLWIYAPCEYRNAVDGPYYDYVLVSGTADPFAKEPTGPAFREIRRVRGFVLYEKVADTTWSGPDEGPCSAPP